MRPGELYDMKADPGETRNLWDSSGSTVKQMATKVRDWGEEHDDDLSIDLGVMGDGKQLDRIVL
jgi:hypothetical protein